MMKVQQDSPNAWSLLLAAGLVACGAGSALDDYSEGVPDVVPSPIVSRPDGGRGDAGADGGKGDGGTQGGGTQGGGAQGGGADVGETCEADDECLEGGQCLTNVDLLITQINFPGGYCTKTPCSSDSQCPSGSGCLSLTMSCLQTCTRNTECRSGEGYTCQAPPLGGLGGATGGGASTARYCLPPSASIGGLGGAGGTGALGGLLGGLGGTGALGGLLGGLGGAGGTTGR